MDDEKEEFELPPGLDVGDYLPPPDMSNNEYLLYKIRAKTGLPFSTIKIIVENYFSEMRKALLNNGKIMITNIGILHRTKRGLKFKSTSSIKKLND